MNTKNDCPIWQKYAVTIDEATVLYNIGEHTLRRIIAENPNAGWLLRIGNKTLIKRDKFSEELDKVNTI